jgi:hypothetical protein
MVSKRKNSSGVKDAVIPGIVYTVKSNLGDKGEKKRTGATL